MAGELLASGMATRFVNIDRDTPLLLPPDLREWVPANHLAHFILDAVESIDLRQVQVNTRGTGDAQYPPAVFGIIKSAMGFRQFLLRGKQKVSIEWTLVCLAYNVRRLHTLNLAAKLAAAG